MKIWLEINLQLKKEDWEKLTRNLKRFQHGLLYVLMERLEQIPREEETGEQEKLSLRSEK